MENLSENNCNVILLLLIVLFFPTMGLAATNRISSVTQLVIGPSLASNSVVTNVSFFTNPVYKFPPTGMEYPEVQALFEKDIFKDVFEKDTETALRRFEIEFAIAVPAVFILNRLILQIVGTFETGDFYAPFDTTRNVYWYTSSFLICGAIAFQDYSDQKRKREAKGQHWDLFRKKF